ncbi:mechanosensitive channel MscK [Volucribacter amazonae]|uniref:Potassium transporter KefA n=1 Tax=Volucribacter amazonae TaxID=256731 RepID=A0A9X4SHE0_9PAST|nr:mechanosensitive channel MscK [Volucribacter amazonae]MDG6894360.1 potassium transporter KefA [Volucribacter amazonae]
MKLRRIGVYIMLLLGIVTCVQAAVPSLEDLRTQLEGAKADNSSSAEHKLMVQNLEEAVSLVSKINQQKQANERLENEIANAGKLLAESQNKLRQLRQQSAVQSVEELESQSLTNLQSQLENTFQKVQEAQSDLAEVNATVVSQSTVPERSQMALKDNLVRSQEINSKLLNLSPSDSSPQTEALRNRLELEQELIELSNRYHQMLLRGHDSLTVLYESQSEEDTLALQQLQAQLANLQQAINAKHLQESRKQVQQATELEQNTNADNPVIVQELALNTRFSQILLQNTAQMNALSQDDLRITNVLDNLRQMQRNIEEQISALQGTLVLSRIINKQKQALPQDQMIKGLSKTIGELRVQIFDTTEIREHIYNTNSYIAELEQTYKTQFDEKVRSELEKILQERYKILNDLIKLLNNQLNLAITIELNQQEVLSISDTLQSKLRQQSFWVASNNRIDLDWLESFPRLAIAEIGELARHINLASLTQNIIPLGLFILIALAGYSLIIYKKPSIKKRLTSLAEQVNTLKRDSHWHTPEALFWTVILALPSTLIFVSLASLATYVIFQNLYEGWKWACFLAGYWLFFATILSLLRPNGLAYRHFGMPQGSNEIFRIVIKKSILVISLIFGSFIFSYLQQIDFSRDVIGQVMLIVALILCQFVILPLLTKAINRYENTVTETGEIRSTKLLRLVKIVLFLTPSSLIVLVVLGYYYTAVELIKYLFESYMVVVIWIFGRQIVYRFLSVSSRRMAYRRLQKRREDIRQQLEVGEDKAITEADVAEKSIKIATVNQQIFRMADLIAWVVLILAFYAVWSDLFSVAYYLDGVILWESIETTAKGTVANSITLLNLMRAMLVLLAMYMLVRNLKGILEVLIFSRSRFSQGTPHTITSLLSYCIIVIGLIWSFTNLGLSWNKLQWLFTALSVGLGFGVREIFGSFVSGIILLFERPIRVGDKVTVGQFTGVVTKIRLRSTTLLDSDDKDVVLPNQSFVTERFINWTLSNSMTRLVVHLSVAYGSDLDLVHKLLLQSAKEAPKVLETPEPQVNFLNFGEHGLEYELLVHVPTIDDRVPMTNFLNYRINQLFNLNHIEIAFNQLNVNIRNQELSEDSQPHQLFKQ